MFRNHRQKELHEALTGKFFPGVEFGLQLVTERRIRLRPRVVGL